MESTTFSNKKQTEKERSLNKNSSLSPCPSLKSKVASIYEADPEEGQVKNALIDHLLTNIEQFEPRMKKIIKELKSSEAKENPQEVKVLRELETRERENLSENLKKLMKILNARNEVFFRSL